MKVLREQIFLAEAQHLFTRPALSHAGNGPSSEKPTQVDVHQMHTRYLKEIYHSTRTEVMRSVEDDLFWNESLSEPMPRFVEIVQVYGDKTATTLKAKAIVAYKVHLVSLNFSKKFCLHLIEHGYISDQFLPVPTSELSSGREKVYLGLKRGTVLSIVVPSMDSIPVPYSNNSRDVQQLILHDAMHQKLQCLILSVHGGLPVYFSESFWCFHPVIVLYCCDTSENKDISSVKHGYSCTSCLTEKDDIAVLLEGATRDPCKMKCTYNVSKTSIDQFD